MRDPKRIDIILEELGAYWKANPDHRLCQIIYNATRDANGKGRDIFNIEDAYLFQNLMDMANRGS